MRSHARDLYVYLVPALLRFCFVYATDAHDASQADVRADKLDDQKGHLKAFGESGTRLEVDVSDKFPPPEEFFRKYVQQSRPLKLQGAVRDTRACRLWTDDYLLSLELPEGEGAHVFLETRKKENRTQETLSMHFHEFLKVYNGTEYYMVDEVPEYLRSDVMLPCSLQCPELYQGDKMALAMMWFSSGGTKSVVHTDSFDNINCLFRGEKTFIMVDPAVHREKVDLNNEGAHSDIDVDSVDLTKHPKLAEVEFYHINMTAGDCLYIPYIWIHQVRSYNSNVAVNFWWNHYASLDALEKGMSCLDTCDHQLTLKDVRFGGADAFQEPEGIRDLLVNMLISSGQLDPQDLLQTLTKMFDQLDLDKDGVLTLPEAKQTTNAMWKEIANDMAVLTSMLDDLYPDAVEEGNGHIKDEL
ncbi:hypothetical protein BaRGS_00013949 [Batillaria attramentaria]|uniref:JmjC domain-containing protein n=1 Tax=Batillaria attramentaria TaxID=370345 RepID=A0ABD0L5V0_9CAEN